MDGKRVVAVGERVGCEGEPGEDVHRGDNSTEHNGHPRRLGRGQGDVIKASSSHASSLGPPANAPQ